MATTNHIQDLMLDLKKKENTPLYEVDSTANEDNNIAKTEAYLDEESGLMHIGYGHLLEQQQTPEELSAMGIKGELHDWRGFSITINQANFLLEIDIKDAIDSLKPTFDDDFLHTLTQDRFTALVGMSYQLGGYGVQRWKGMCGAILEEKWELASYEMLYSDGTTQDKPSAWFLQTQSRCERAAYAMKYGYFPENAPEEKAASEEVRSGKRDKTLAEIDLTNLSDYDLLDTILDYAEELRKRLKS